jgi:diacylglycerol kinase family enzyme
VNSPAAIDAGVDNEAPAGAITVIVNRKSGSGAEAQRKAITEAFARAKLDAHIRVVDGADIRATAERAAAAGHTLVAAGGDGTVSTVASVAVASGATFGVLPLGTLNHFAKDAGIPLEIGPAVAVIAGGHIVALDTGAINGRTFVNNASLGFYANLVRERQIEQRRGTSKWIAFALGLFRGWTHYRQMRVHMKVDGRPLVRRTPFVFIGNGDYQDEGLDLGRRISLTTGHLCIYLAPECGRLEMLVLLLRALAGRLTPDVKLESFVAADATIDPTRHGRHLAMDGELVIVPPPLQAVSRPGTLRTLLPR